MPIKRACILALYLAFLLLGAAALPPQPARIARAGPSPSAYWYPRPSSSLSSTRKRELDLAQLTMEHFTDPIGGARARERLLGMCSQKGQIRCPSPSGFGTECVSVMNDLESCGGCSTPDALGFVDGTDCTTLENVEDVRCVRGKCQIDACAHGYTLARKTEDADGEMECVGM